MMIWNMTLIGLSLNSSLSISPFFSLSYSSLFQLQSSKFSKLYHPILINNKFSSILFDKLLFKNVYSTLVTCVPLNPVPDQTKMTGCITSSNNTFSYESDNSYSILNANIIISSCIFNSCIAHNSMPIFDIQNSHVTLNNTDVQDCMYIFLKIVSPQNSSLAIHCTFRDCYHPFFISNGGFVFSDSIFSNTATTSDANQYNIYLETCTTVRVMRCSFIFDKLESIYAFQSPDIRITNCNFLMFSSITLSDKSYAMIVSSCFEQNITDVVTNYDDSSFINVDSGVSCPTPNPTPTSEDDLQNYSLATIVVFSTCFSILFVGLTILVFCNVGRNNTTHYGQLHESSHDDDDSISSVDFTE